MQPFLIIRKNILSRIVKMDSTEYYSIESIFKSILFGMIKVPLDDIDADRLVSDHDPVFALVKVFLALAVDKAKITLRVYLEPESLALTSLDELLFEEFKLLYRTCDDAVWVIYIPMYSLLAISVADILHCHFCI